MRASGEVQCGWCLSMKRRLLISPDYVKPRLNILPGDKFFLYTFVASSSITTSHVMYILKRGAVTFWILWCYRRYVGQVAGHFFFRLRWFLVPSDNKSVSIAISPVSLTHTVSLIILSHFHSLPLTHSVTHSLLFIVFITHTLTHSLPITHSLPHSVWPRLEVINVVKMKSVLNCQREVIWGRQGRREREREEEDESKVMSEAGMHIW